MTTSPECPALESWQTLLALSPDQLEHYGRHLESCAVCQSRLDRGEESGDELLRLARQVGDPTAAPADPVLTQILEQLHEAKSPLRPTLTDPPDLYFLHPSDELGVLGTLGDYEVYEVIGQGGMGVVLKALEPALHRLVAIKVMAAAVAGSATARRRFKREAQAAAAVCHDHIVAVHGVHEEDGLPYLVMQYVPGESLQARLDRTGPLELVEIVRIGLQTAQGLAAAHAQGLIHRDIKPANLLLENGLARVKITDFGLARMVDDVGLTQNGVVTGTPEYMAPEQASGGPIDHRADLFSLGSVLYAMCTGRPPFRAATAVAVLLQVSKETPAPVRALNPEVPAWLEAFILRLLAKDPADRFQTAAEVAELLEGYLAHLRQPATIAAPELPSPPAADCQELPAAAFQTGVGKWFPKRFRLPALLLLAVVGLGLANTLPNQPAAVPTATPTAAPVAKAKTWLVVAEVVGLVVTLLLAIPLGVWLYVRQNRRAEKTAGPADVPEESAPPAPSLAFRCSGCGKNLKVRAELAGKKGKCPQCGQAVLVPAPGPGVAPAAPVKDGNKGLAWKKWGLVGAAGLVLGALGGGWYLWASQPKKPLPFGVTLGSEFVPEVEESGFHIQERDKGDLPFRWTDGHAKLVIPIDKRKPPQALAMQIFAFRPPEVKTIPLKIVVNNREVFNQDISLWKWEESLDLSKIDLGEELVLEIISDTFVPRGIMDGGANDDSRALGVQVRGIKLLGPGEEGAERAAGDRPFRIWRGHQDGISCGTLTADGKTLVSCTWDGTIKIWDVATNQERLSLPGLGPNLHAVAVSPDGKTFATAGNDRVVRLWDMETGQLRAAWPGHGGPITALAFAPDGQTLASVGGQRQRAGELKLWDVATGLERVPVEPFPLRLWDVAYAPDGRSVAVAGGDKAAYLIDTRTGKILATIPQPVYVRRVALSPDGKFLAVASGDVGEVQLHEVDGGKERAAFQTPGGQHVFGLAFSPDGKQLLAPCAGGTVLWDVSQPQPAVATTLKGNEGKVWFGVFFPDGQTVATGGDDRTIRLWRIGSTRVAADTPAVTSPSRERVWLVVGGSLALVLIVSCSLGAWLYVRHRRPAGKALVPAAAEDGQARPEPDPAAVSVRTPEAGAIFAAGARPEKAPAAVSFRCPGCGKNLKARPELAGKKIKCSHCGKGGLVPGTAD